MTQVLMVNSAPFMGREPMSVGKVRDIYDFGNYLVIVTTDRISAFDVVLKEPIPNKGVVLTELSAHWFWLTSRIISNHCIRIVDYAEISELPGVRFPSQILGRAMLVKKAKPIGVECIVRGYITGSGWTDYQETGVVSGVTLPKGLIECEELPEPIFTPTTKATEGHDEPITFDDVVKEVGKPIARLLKAKSIELYGFARDYARVRGIIIADTKFEFGMDDGSVILIDECLTPDSSRFWPADQFEPGRSQPSFDKQFVRDYVAEMGWDKEPPPPPLPDDVVAQTAEKYRQALKLLTGRDLSTKDFGF